MQRVPGVILVIVALSGHAMAQSGGSSTIAEQLFNQARELARANRWADACPKFEASLHYDPVLGTRLNLAACYEHTGKLASAWGLYREAIELAKKAGDHKRRDYAQKQAAALEARLAKLAISAPATPPAGLTITRDGTPVDTGTLGIPLYVDAGPHEIKASAPGFEDFTQTVTLVDGKTETLTLPDLKALPVQSPEPPKPASPEPVARVATTVAPKPGPTAAPSRTRTYLAVGVGAAGVVTTGVGFLFGAKASSSYSDAKALCGSSLVCNTSPDYEKGKQLIHDARSNATTSTILVAAGGAAIVAGIVVFLTAPTARERNSAAIVPFVHDGGTGVAITGGF